MNELLLLGEGGGVKCGVVPTHWNKDLGIQNKDGAVTKEKRQNNRRTKLSHRLRGLTKVCMSHTKSLAQGI